MERLCDFSHSVTQVASFIFSGGCLIFFAERLPDFFREIFFVESLHDFFVEGLHNFFWWTGCVISFVEGLPDFVCSEVV